MQVCRRKDDYITYLWTGDNTVLKNKSELRPYVGFVIAINNLNYYVTLSSPKPKHKSMKNSKDFHKIAGGIYGAINFNKIIPVPKDCIINFKFEDETDKEYRSLLQNQYKVINTMESLIKKKANDIYKLFHISDDELTKSDLKVKERCCDFDLLEKMCKTYKDATK